MGFYPPRTNLEQQEAIPCSGPANTQVTLPSSPPALGHQPTAGPHCPSPQEEWALLFTYKDYLSACFGS